MKSLFPTTSHGGAKTTAYKEPLKKMAGEVHN